MGSDTRSAWALVVYGASLLSVGALLGVRVLAPPAGTVLPAARPAGDRSAVRGSGAR